VENFVNFKQCNGFHQSAKFVPSGYTQYTITCLKMLQGNFKEGKHFIKI